MNEELKAALAAMGLNKAAIERAGKAIICMQHNPEAYDSMNELVGKQIEFELLKNTISAAVGGGTSRGTMNTTLKPTSARAKVEKVVVSELSAATGVAPAPAKVRGGKVKPDTATVKKETDEEINAAIAGDAAPGIDL